ncbi:uncharacterized protein BDZ99DRAFT_501497 [Mytilinidion resinicola]|uniref:Fungal STAND N-terminal Goodbye domain-containing protein n=1 Tax=Mytilinidion resinicola TaxID=574789 RepID=A0A6A6YB74_9PEZI|nr:uncharacterized protein BDZ99DRAFT_501497 [Mytilinidion resinicola]KAF2805950.1 hypothetical protein BDZ99DRAFT_501497 [Mytilinidion resinicola]
MSASRKASQGRKSSTQRRKKARDEELQAKIEKIWEEVNEDVEWLSQPPSDDKRKKWRFTRIFHGGGTTKTKDDPKSQPESDKNEHKHDIKVSTAKILGILHNVKPEPSKDKSAKYEKFEKTVTNTIKCINWLGERVASAASVTFAPAPSCFNAISFFLQFWINYVEMFDKLDQLLSTCNDFIGRLHIYEMDEFGEKVLELQYIATQLLQSTVKVFRLSISISSSSKDVMKNLMKKSFLGESDIDELIGGMEKLVEQENNLLTALSYGNVRNIRQILEQQQTTADANGWRIAIAKALGFGDDEPKRVWRNRLEEITASLIPETGDWVKELKEFKDWVALDEDNAAGKEKDSKPTRPILLIEGAESTGKSYLMANIATRFIEPNHSIAYYFHDGASDLQMDRYRLLSLVSRSLAWQCATFSGLLMKSMAERCQIMGNNPNVYDVWRQLFVGNEEIKKVKRPFYILIDGLEGNMLKDIISFVNQLVDSGEETFRVLVSTRSSSVQEHMKEGSFGRICLRDDKKINNHSDIETYIQRKLDNMPAFDGTHHPKAEDYRKDITKTLREQTEGDFAWMAIILDKLRSKHHLTDIDKILQNVQEPRVKQVENEIKRLNRELTSEEIKEINEVILWLLTSQVTPTLDDMKAVLSLGPHTDSLMPLHRRLNPLLSANESGRIQFRLSEIKKQILEKQSLVAKQSSSETSVSSRLIEAEVELVHRFLTHVLPRKADYDKDELQRILWDEFSQPLKPTICYDEQNAHIRVALTYLEVLTSKSDEQTRRLRPNAGKYLLYHLKKTQRKVVRKDLKEKIGPLLVKLFTEDDCIDTLFWTRAEHMSHTSWQNSEGLWLKENRERWLYTSTGVIEMAKWLSDLEVVDGIVGSGKILVTEFNDKKNASCRHEILLQAAAKRLATHLFLENIYTRREQLTAVYFLNGYVTRMGNQKDVSPCQKDRDRLQWEEFRRIRDWATKLDGFEKKSSHNSWSWKIQVARTIFTICDRYDKNANNAAKHLLREVQNIDEKLWEGSVLACQTIAEQLLIENSHAKAQKVLEKATARYLKNEGEVPASSDKMLVAIAFLDLGDLYWKEKQYDQAAAMYRQSLKYDATRYARYLKILRLYNKREDWPETIGLLKELTEVKKSDKLYLNRLVYDFVAEDSFRKSLVRAKEHKDWKQVVDKTFTQAIDVANGSPAELFHIRKVYGQILHECADASREDDVIEQWEKALESGKPLAVSGNPIQWSHLADIIEPLAKIYLRRAENTLGKARAANSNEAMPAYSVKETFDMASHDVDLLKRLEQKTDIWVNTTVFCCLARYYMVSKDTVRAKKAVVKVIAASIAVLSDSDESNDWFAYVQLGKVFNALQDTKNSEQAWKRLDKFGKPPSDQWPPFYCAGCNTKVPLAKGVHVCKECFGPKYFDKECYDKRDLKGCSTTHGSTIFFPEAKESKIIISDDDQIRENSLKQWKVLLQGKYLEGADIGDAAKIPIVSLTPDLTRSKFKRLRRDTSLTSITFEEDELMDEKKQMSSTEKKLRNKKPVGSRHHSVLRRIGEADEDEDSSKWEERNDRKENVKKHIEASHEGLVDLQNEEGTVEERPEEIDDELAGLVDTVPQSLEDNDEETLREDTVPARIEDEEIYEESDEGRYRISTY